jgi:hypothetical protein
MMIWKQWVFQETWKLIFQTMCWNSSFNKYHVSRSLKPYVNSLLNLYPSMVCKCPTLFIKSLKDNIYIVVCAFLDGKHILVSDWFECVIYWQYQNGLVTVQDSGWVQIILILALSHKTTA